jgi:hypothetical protein
MIKISKFTSTDENEYPEGSAIVNFIDYSETDKIITYKKTVNNTTIFAFKINVSDIYSLADFAEQTFWGIDIRAIGEYKKISEEFYTVDSKYIVNLLKKSLPDKNNSLLVNSNTGEADMVFFLPYNTNTSQDIIFRVQDNPIFTTVESSGEIVEVEHASWKEIIAPIEAASFTQDENFVTVSLSTDPKISKVYVEQVNGLINKTSVTLVNGQGTFSILKLGLESGQIAAAKIGHKYYTGLLNFSTTI